ncbi:MAG: helix-turn-helix domain-containing protein [Rhodopila sp.]
MAVPSVFNIDLKKQREDAGLKQAELARRLGIAQSQVQRYETNPDNVPLRMAQEWIAACGHPDTDAGLDPGMPYVPIQQRLAQLGDYAANQPVLLPEDMVAPPLDIGDLRDGLRQLGRKPRLVLWGRFDAGKSRLANTLFGADRLPTAYQPATAVVCLVRHIQDKPIWQTENVWIMDETFNLGDADDKDKCEEQRLLAGDFETLSCYGMHVADHTRRSVLKGKPGSALIYIDAPLLQACDLIDTPGYGHHAYDDKLAGSAKPYGDALVYMAPFTGFMNDEDIAKLQDALVHLPALPGNDRVRNLLILATHVHSGVKDAEVAGALDAAARRLHDRLRAGAARAVDAPPLPDAAAFRGRMFGWFVEQPALRASVEADLRELLTSVLPEAIGGRLDEAVSRFRSTADAFLNREIGHVEDVLRAGEQAAQDMAAFLAEEPERRARIENRKRRVTAIIHAARTATAAFIEQEVAPLFTTEGLGKIIEDKKFRNATDAQGGAVDAVMREARARIEQFLTAQAEPLADEVEILLRNYDLSASSGIMETSVPFDARAAFLGSLAGGGTFGALAGWAAIVAGGSNLGAYLLVPQVVSLLARLGIGIAGGTATGVSIVSALGGPVGIGIGIALTAGIVAWQAFGRSWQSRLVAELEKQITAKNVLGEIWVRCEDFWNDSLRAFNQAIGVTEAEYAQHLGRLEAQLATPARVLRERADRIAARRAFLIVLPWRPLEGVKS